MMTITLTDDVSPLLQRRLKTAAKNRDAMTIVGRASSELWRDHLYKKDAKPNKLGGKRTHYWRDAGDSVHFDMVSGTLTMTASQVGIRMKYEGGKIEPVEKDALTIPIHKRAHGKSALEFPNLELVPSHKENDEEVIGVLAMKTGKTDKLTAYYVLRRWAKIPEDKTILPTNRQISGTAIDAYKRWFDAYIMGEN